MIDRNAIQTAIRKTRRLEHLGDGPRVCFICGYEDPIALVAMRAADCQKSSSLRTLLEDHHVAGRRNDPKLTIPLCRNCHAELTEDLRCEDVSMKAIPNRRRPSAWRLLGLASLFERIAEALRRWASEEMESEDDNA